MRATSKASFEAASARWEPVLDGAGDRSLAFGEELYAVSDLIASSAPLSRALTDPSRRGDDKAALAERVLRGTVADEVVELVGGLVRERWSAPADLAHALEVLAVDSVLAAAEARGDLESVEDDLFRVERLLVSERPLRLALSNRDLPAERRVGLVEALFGGRVTPETALFVRRATATLHERSMTSALRAIASRAAARRERLVATVITAAPLSDAQVSRLGDILERAYGRAVQVNVGIDARMIGGLRVTVGSEVVDATVLGRLAEVRTRLAG